MADDKTYTQGELDEAVAKAVAKAMAKEQKQHSVVQDTYVSIMYLGQFAQGTTVSMPYWGVITVPGDTLDIPKKDFIKGMGAPLNSELVRQRRIIVVDGLTTEERKRFGVDYAPDEILTKKAFDTMLDLSQDGICKAFAKLCKEHKAIVSQVYHTAYFGDGITPREPDKRINIETVKRLNKLSKEVDKNGMFIQILEDYGRRFATE